MTVSTKSSVCLRALIPAVLAGFFVLSFFTVAGAQNITSFELQLNDVSGLDEAWPLIGGLPFPEGELNDASRIRIVDAEGNEVPSQIDVAATWRDGSIRWALAGFTASPQADYTVQFGPDVSRSEPSTPLTVTEGDNGTLTVDTGAAVYTFDPAGLLPNRATMGDAIILREAGDGAYLVDNRGRTARVSGDEARISSELHKEGPARLVVRRAGWYVTSEGERVARAKMWFYFTAGIPYVRMTHSLVLTEDTNDWWVRDYGLELTAGAAAEEVAFALSEPAPSESMRPHAGTAGRLPEEEKYDIAHLFSGMYGREWRLFTAEPNGDELYMLQEDYPHNLKRDYHAVIGRVRNEESDLPERAVTGGDNLWLHTWEKQMQVAGDWADGRYENHALTVVMPWLAQRFPKEIAFNSEGARVSFWSGRSGRALDFRPVTLVNEYWQSWAQHSRHLPKAERPSPKAATELAKEHTNAQGAARTHELWLLPRTAEADAQTLKARATAAARPPQVLADPEWLTATEAMGWPMHPKDTQRFPAIENNLSHLWQGLMVNRHNAGLRRTGFIGWGANTNLHHYPSFFRVGSMTDYALRWHAWGMYARSAEQEYREYASRFDRFLGDWALGHWTVGGKRRGAFVDWEPNVPFHWGHDTKMWHGVTGHGITQWLLEYYLTGDEYAIDLTRMIGDAYKEVWDADALPKIVGRNNGIYGILGILTDLYTHEWDEELGRMARQLARQLIDLKNPRGRSDEVQYGVLYKIDRALLGLYKYYKASGDEKARKAILKGLDQRYRNPTSLEYGRLRNPYTSQNYSGLLYSEAYRWTGRNRYLRIVNRLVQEARRQEPSSTAVNQQMHAFGALPTAMELIAEVDDQDIAPFPLLKTAEPSPIVFRKEPNEPVEIRMFVRMSDNVAEDAQTVTNIRAHDDGDAPAALDKVRVEVEQQFATSYNARRDLRRRHVHVFVPATTPAGRYLLRIPDATRLVVLESSASEIAWLDTNDTDSGEKAQ